MPSSKFTYCFITLICFFSAQLSAEELPYWYKVKKKDEKTEVYEGPSLLQDVTLGYQYKKVDIKFDDSEGSELAHFRGITDAAFFELTSRDLIRRWTSVSFIVNIGYGQFDLNKQVVNGQERDLGTHLEARYSFMMANFSLNVIDHNIDQYRFDGLRITAGAGIGDISIRGTAVRGNSVGGSPRTFYYERGTTNTALSVSYHYYGLLARVRSQSTRSLSFLIVEDSLSFKEKLLELAYRYEF